MAQRSIDDFLPYLLSRASHLVSQRFYALLKREGMPIREWRVLATLFDGDGVPLGELADIVITEQSTATRLVERMAARGLVEKVVDRADRRRALVHITPLGRRAVAGLMEQARAIDGKIGADFDRRRNDALKAELKALIASFDPGEAE